ncbi:DUF2064 domain-containing protein [Hyphomonas sp.]|uniref:TIGR04282 family arsenosugar biosynthesis glycosyltransferase n=1 Tax=Hyphomonas sp. TaxID=87 RepID=UPI0025BE723B|nr:DUF2064 domain-containing protein [Hyphomonas sp.]
MRPAILFVFAKPPRIGLSKTRLAKGLGLTTARRIAAFTLARTLQAAKGSGCAVTIYVAPDRLVRAAQAGQTFAGLPLAPQGSGGLTERLGLALHHAPPGPVLFIGADAPDVTAGKLRAAVALLRRKDAVFGPASDGGFWLFGLHKGPRAHDPFGGVRWSGPHAMEDVWSNLPRHSRIGLLEQLTDIDEAADWKAWTRGAR